MCDPTTLLAVAATGQIVGAYSAFQNSQAQASALKANANADLQQGYQNELDSRAKSRSQLASQMAALSDRGVDLSSGTPLDLLRASARNAEVDALRVRADGLNKYNAERYAASNALKSGFLTAGGQLLMGAASSAVLGGLGKIGGGTPVGQKSGQEFGYT